MELTDNDLLDIELRNKGNMDVVTLLTAYRDMLDVMRDARRMVSIIPAEEYVTIGEFQLANSVAWQELTELLGVA